MIQATPAGSSGTTAGSGGTNQRASMRRSPEEPRHVERAALTCPMHQARALAAAQSTPVPGDVARNIEQHLALATLAASASAKTVLFPELSLTGYELNAAPGLAFSPTDPRLTPLRAFAAASGVTLIVGAPVRLQSHLHIGALVVLPSGDVGVYTKHHLGSFGNSPTHGGPVPPPEWSVFEPGLENPVVECGTGRASIAVCADIGHESHARNAADRGAQTYLASAFLIPDDYEADVTRLEEYAVRHRMAVVLANFGGPTGGLPSAGGSAIWSASGDPASHARGGGSGRSHRSGTGRWMAHRGQEAAGSLTRRPQDRSSGPNQPSQCSESV